MSSSNNDLCFNPKPSLLKRPLISDAQASALEAIFKTLANTTRLRILHALVRTDKLCVSDLSGQLGMKPQAVSNQLQILANREIVESERAGVQMFYRIIDPCVIALLDRGWCLAEDADSRARYKITQEEVAS